MKKIIVNDPLLDAEEVRLSGLADYIPKYLYQPMRIECNWLSYHFFNLFLGLVTTLLKVFLKPRKDQVGHLDLQEVETVYDREASNYDWKHHLTTRGQDTFWRRQAGWLVSNVARKSKCRPKVLDLCTGTGLTIKEMITILVGNGQGADITGLDYNSEMLRMAQKRNGQSCPGLSVDYVRGDAMRLSLADDKEISLAQYEEQTFDLVTQVFGIGGIDGSVEVFRNVLMVLKPEGYYQMTDMHQPLAHQPGEVPFLWRWFNSPAFEYLAYHYHTVPVALNRLWGWKDPTLDFYRLPLVTILDQDGWWGFEISSFEVESQRWWLGLPIMPVARIVVRKVAISEKEATKRERALTLL